MIDKSVLEDIRLKEGFYLANDLEPDISKDLQKKIIKSFLCIDSIEYLCDNMQKHNMEPYYEDKGYQIWMSPELMNVYLAYLNPDLIEIFNDIFDEDFHYKPLISGYCY